MRKSKIKSVTMLTLILSCVSLLSIGFATWVIAIPSSQVISGNIKVEEVEDRAIAFDVSWVDDEDSIIFAAPQNANKGWLISNNQIYDSTSSSYVDTKENLEVILKVEFTSGTKADLDLYKFEFKFVPAADSKERYDNLVTKTDVGIKGFTMQDVTYITAPTYYAAPEVYAELSKWKEINPNDTDETSSANIHNVIASFNSLNNSDDKLDTLYIKVIFNWGSVFSQIHYTGSEITDKHPEYTKYLEPHNPFYLFNDLLIQRDYLGKPILDENDNTIKVGPSDFVPGSGAYTPDITETPEVNEENWTGGITYAEVASELLNNLWGSDTDANLNFELTFGAVIKSNQSTNVGE